MLNDKEASELITELYNGFGGFRSACDDNDKIRKGKQAIPLPELYKDEFVPLHHSYEGQHAYNVLMQERARANPVYSIYSRAIQSERQEGAQNFEHYMNRQLVIWFETPIFDLTGADQIGRGAGMYKLDLRTAPTENGKYDVWPDKPSKNGQEPKDWAKEVDGYKLRTPTPFVLEAVDIRAVAWERGRDERVVSAAEKSKRKVLNIAQLYGWEVRNGRIAQLGPALPEGYAVDPNHKSVEFAELCTADRIYHVIANVGDQGGPSHRIVGSYPNPFGACRYILAPGLVRQETLPEERYIPLIEGALKVADERSYFGTMRKFAAAINALPIPDILTDENGVVQYDTKTGKPVTIKLGVFTPSEYQIPPGSKIQPRFQGVVTEMDRYDAMLQQELQRYGPSEVLTGGSAGEREAAWALALRGEKAEGGIAPVIEGQRKALREIARQTAWCVKNYLKEDVLIWTVLTDEFGKQNREQVRVKPDDIEEDFDIDVDMGYKNTALQLANRGSLREGWVDGNISRRRVQEEGWNVSDAAAEDRQIELEKIEEVLKQIVLWPAIQAAVPAAREALGLPPAPPEEIAAMQAAVFGLETQPQPGKREAAGGVHTTGEAAPTPIRQRILQ